MAGKESESELTLYEKKYGYKETKQAVIGRFH